MGSRSRARSPGPRAANGGASLSDTTHRAGTGLRRFFAIVPLANEYPALHGLRLIAIVLAVQVHLFHLLVIKKITNGLIENVPFTDNLDFLGHWLAGLTATLLISYVFAYALHLLVEKPSLYLRRRLT